MEQPISIGWVLLKLFETLWRLFFLCCAFVAVVWLAIWVTEGKSLSSQVSIELGQPTESCSKQGFPIEAAIINRSGKTLGEVDVQLSVYSRGRSDNVAVSGSRHDLRYIVGPHESFSYCFGMPGLEEGATGPFVVAAEVTYVEELSKDVPTAAQAPPPIQTMDSPKAGRSKKSIWEEVEGLLVVASFFVAITAGGYGVLKLFDEVFGTSMAAKATRTDDKGERGCGALFIIGFVNAGCVVAGAYVLDAVGWGGWMKTIDQWSRTNGYNDAGSMLLTGLVCLWPWPILLLTSAVSSSRSQAK